MPKSDDLTLLSTEIRDELERDAKILARELFGQGSPDMQQLSRPDLLDYVRRNWADAGVRARLLQRVGPKHFLEIAQDAWPEGWAPPPVPLGETLLAPSPVASAGAPLPVDEPAPPVEPEFFGGPTSTVPGMGG